MKTPFTPVLVQWDDAHASSGIHTLDEVEEFHKAKPTFTVGFLVKNDASGVTVAMDCWEQEDEGCHTVTFIPRWMIRSIVKLARAKDGPQEDKGKY